MASSGTDHICHICQLRTDLGERQLGLPARFNVDLLVKNRQIGYHRLY